MCDIVNAYQQERLYGGIEGHVTIRNCRYAGVRRFSTEIGPFDDHADFWRWCRSIQRAEHEQRNG